MTTTILFRDHISTPFLGNISNDLTELFFLSKEFRIRLIIKKKVFAFGFKINT